MSGSWRTSSAAPHALHPSRHAAKCDRRPACVSAKSFAMGFVKVRIIHAREGAGVPASREHSRGQSSPPGRSRPQLRPGACAPPARGPSRPRAPGAIPHAWPARPWRIRTVSHAVHGLNLLCITKRTDTVHPGHHTDVAYNFTGVALCAACLIPCNISSQVTVLALR